MITYTVQEKVGIIEIARHEKRNALNLEMTQQFHSILDTIEHDKPRLIAITGQGSSFCAGADLDGSLYDENFLREHVSVLHRLQSIDVPVVAVINGPAMGAGLQLALAADIRLMSPQAKIGIPAPKIGITVDAWTIKRLSAIIGNGHARTLLFCLEDFNAEKCLATGFANKISSKEEAFDFVHFLSVLAPLTFRHYKKAFNDDRARDDVDPEIHQAMVDVWTSQDLERGKEARVTRIFPDFQGN